ncbi:hypothetical protein FRC12_009495 [Ceratobasidium sp. 428]|nr:hypothetical protein FRC12_009495 [Ceratobasidium sp. 428]
MLHFPSAHLALSSEGYVPEGPEFDEDGAPHQRMVWRAPAPSDDTDTGLPIESK